MIRAACAVMLVMALAAPAWAHFGMVIPESAMVERPGELGLEFRFWHPMEDQGMDLPAPKAMVDFAGRRSAVELSPARERGAQFWKGSYRIKRPGDYIFYMEPQPYWEPAEDAWIVHYTKTVVDALGAEEGWDRALGLPMEIIPYTRPYGLWAGNSFTGQVLLDGKPLAGAEVEVEFYNAAGEIQPPAGPFITQVVRADDNGVFTYTMPWAGWWGFAALATAENKLPKDGQPKPVEIGGVLWVHAEAPR